MYFIKKNRRFIIQDSGFYLISSLNIGKNVFHFMMCYHELSSLAKNMAFPRDLVSIVLLMLQTYFYVACLGFQLKGIRLFSLKPSKIHDKSLIKNFQCISDNVSCLMEFLTCMYKISLISSKKVMVFKEIAVFCEVFIHFCKQTNDFYKSHVLLTLNLEVHIFFSKIMPIFC